MDPSHSEEYDSMQICDEVIVNSPSVPSRQYKPHNFDINISNVVLTDEQDKIFYTMLENPDSLHVLTRTHRKAIFIKYITQYFQAQNKHILLCAATGATTLRLSCTASTVHTMFCILTWGYVALL